MRTRNDRGRYDLSQFSTGGCTGFDRRLYGRNIAGKSNGHHAIAHAMLAHVSHIGGLERRISGFHRRNQPFGLNHTDCLLCHGEKEVFVVEKVFDRMMTAMARAGAHRLDAGQVDRLTKAAFTWKDNHHVVNKDLVGKDCAVLAAAAGTMCPTGTDLLYGQTDEANPFVPEEQMMPFVPLVPVANVDEAIDLALKHEHGFGHTAIIHSNDLVTITRMGRAMNTTLFAVNGPSTACLGIGGEGYPSYTVATPTGEGVTNPLTFTRFRRMSISGALRVV